MTPEKTEPDENECKCCQTLEEICENTRAIRRVVNRILDQMHEYTDKGEYGNNNGRDFDDFTWNDMDNNDDIFM
jgi:hypothetical protein